MWKQNKLPRNCVGFFAKLPKAIHQNHDWIQQGVIYVTAGVILKMNADKNKFTSNSEIHHKLLCSMKGWRMFPNYCALYWWSVIKRIYSPSLLLWSTNNARHDYRLSIACDRANNYEKRWKVSIFGKENVE